MKLNAVLNISTHFEALSYKMQINFVLNDSKETLFSETLINMKIQALLFATWMIAVAGKYFHKFFLITDDAIMTDLELRNIQLLDESVEFYSGFYTIGFEKKDNFFCFNDNGFSMILRTKDKSFAENLLTDKHKIQFKSFEIGYLEIQSVNCVININENGIVHKIMGEHTKTNATSDSILMQFNAKSGSHRRRAFDENIDLKLKCHAKYKLNKDNHPMFQFQDLQNLGIIEEIFGSADETYMTMS